MLDQDTLDDQLLVWTQRASTGMVDVAGARDIPDGAASVLYDADLRIEGERRSRSGASSVYDVPGWTLAAMPGMRGIMAWNAKATSGIGSNYLLAMDGYSLRRYDGTTWSTVSTVSSEVGDFRMCEGYDSTKVSVFCVQGTSTGYKYDGTTLAALTLPIAASYCAWFQDRLFVAKSDTVCYSDALTPGTFGGSSLFLAEAGAYGAITGIIPWDDYILLIFKERAVLSLRCAGGTPTTDWDLSVLAPDHGCVAPNSIVRAGRDVLFLSDDGIRSITKTVTGNETPGAAPPISYPISTALGSARHASAYTTGAAATYFDRMMIMAYSSGSMYPTTRGNDLCAVMFDHPDPMRRIWTLWRTGDIPACAFSGFATMLNNTTGAPVLYAINGAYTPGDTFAYRDVVRLDQGGLAGYRYQEVSRAYGAGALRRMRPYYAEVVCRQIAANGGTLTLYTQKDESGSWTSQGTLSLSGTATDGLLSLKVPLETLGACRTLRLKFDWTGATAGTLAILEHTLAAIREPVDRQV